MTTPTSGPISFSQIRNELDWNTAISIGSYRPRLLASKSTGTINTSDLYNKTAIGKSFTTLLSYPTNSYPTYATYVNDTYFYSVNNGTAPNNTSYLYKSTTGTSFTQVDSITTTTTYQSTRYNGLLYEGGYYVAFGSKGYSSGNYPSPIVKYSTNGGNSFSTGYNPETPGQTTQQASYGAAGNGVFLVAGNQSGDTYVRSTTSNISSWTTPSGRPTGNIVFLSFLRDAFFMITQTGSSPFTYTLYRSTDALTWTAVLSYGTNVGSYDILYNGTYYITYFVPPAGQMSYHVSPDGISWTAVSSASLPTASGKNPFLYPNDITVVPALGAYFMAAVNSITASDTRLAAVWTSTDFANWTCVFESGTTGSYCGAYTDVEWSGLAMLSNGGYGQFWYGGNSTGYYINLSATGTTNFVNKQNNLGSESENACVYLLGFTSDNSKPLVGVMANGGLVISQR